jgi:hypothetical protein
LWKAYIQLTEAESAFRIHKSDLNLRPIWHQKKERVQAHILVCFLTYVIWKTLARSCSASGLGDEPRKVFPEDRGTNPDGGCSAADEKRHRDSETLRCKTDETSGNLAAASPTQPANKLESSGKCSPDFHSSNGHFTLKKRLIASLSAELRLTPCLAARLAGGY